MSSARAFAIAALLVSCVLSLAETKSNEHLVSVRTSDDIVQTGFFAEPAKKAGKIAVIWLPGAAQNFYFPSYVEIARRTAARGSAFLSVNTRMHDLGCFLAYREPQSIRGGTIWGRYSEEYLDIIAWIDFAASKGYEKVVLVGHSAGGTTLCRFMAEKGDLRIAGIVLASASVAAHARFGEAELIKTAQEMIEKGKGQDLVPNRRISYQTYLDLSQFTDSIFDFFGEKSLEPGVDKLHVPLLAWFGTKEPDEGTAADLEKMLRLVNARPSKPPMVDTAMIQGASHLYLGAEEEVSKVLAGWISKLATSKKGEAKAPIPHKILGPSAFRIQRGGE